MLYRYREPRLLPVCTAPSPPASLPLVAAVQAAAAAAAANGYLQGFEGLAGTDRRALVEPGGTFNREWFG